MVHLLFYVTSYLLSVNVCLYNESFFIIQLIYDCIDGGASIGLISLRTDELPEEDKRRFEEIGIQLPSMM